MTPEEKERVDSLCKQIMNERNPEKLVALCNELDRLLETVQQRLSNTNMPPNKAS